MKVLSRETVSVDMAFAFHWLSNPFPHQRPLSRAVVEDYKADMRGGRWSIGEGAIIIGVRPQGRFLVSGQHRLTAVFELESVTVDMTVCFFEFETDQEMLEFYAGGTNKGKPMGLSASLQVLGTAGVVGVPTAILAQAAASLNLIMNQFEHRNNATGEARRVKSPETMDRAMRALQGPVYSYYHLMDGMPSSERKYFKRSAVMALGIATLRAQPDKAIGFWRACMENDGLRKGEPAHTLRAYLARTEANGDKTYDYCCTVAACWNSYFRDEPRRDARPTAARTDKGIIIAGTEWKGRGDVNPLKALCVEMEGVK